MYAHRLLKDQSGVREKEGLDKRLLILVKRGRLLCGCNYHGETSFWPAKKRRKIASTENSVPIGNRVHGEVVYGSVSERRNRTAAGRSRLGKKHGRFGGGGER